MHELPITQSIIRICCQEADKNNIDKVKSITLNVGEVAPVVPESIRYYYDIISKGTKVEGAELIIKVIPVIIKCMDCSNEFKNDFHQYECKICGGKNVVLVSGRELMVDVMGV